MIYVHFIKYTIGISTPYVVRYFRRRYLVRSKPTPEWVQSVIDDVPDHQLAIYAAKTL